MQYSHLHIYKNPMHLTARESKGRTAVTCRERAPGECASTGVCVTQRCQVIMSISRMYTHGEGPSPASSNL